MRRHPFFSYLLGCLLYHSLVIPGLASEPLVASKPIKIVAAENFYGAIAQQIGGTSVVVTSIINNPNQDPHEFQVAPAIAKMIADADIVIYNGIGYDTWIEKMLTERSDSHRLVINVATLVGAKMGDNPHLWYDPHTMVALAKKLGQLLKRPAALQDFQDQMRSLFEKIDFLQKTYKNLTVTATEPLFGAMVTLLKWNMLHSGYQWAMMNGTEPSFEEIAAYQKSLQTKKVKLLFYNSQVTNPSTEQMQLLAKKNGIPIIGITETQPAVFTTYQEWMAAELAEIEKALTSAPHDE